MRARLTLVFDSATGVLRHGVDEPTCYSALGSAAWCKRLNESMLAVAEAIRGNVPAHSRKANDLVTGRLIMAPLSPALVAADVRKASGSVRAFHNRSELDTCPNRSGRLVEYHGLDGEDLTIYNDGGIEYRALGARNMNRDKLSAAERSALLRAFAAVRDRPIAWLWPQDLGVKLGDVPPAGPLIGSEEFERHKALYASILKAWTYGARGLNSIDNGSSILSRLVTSTLAFAKMESAEAAISVEVHQAHPASGSSENGVART